MGICTNSALGKRDDNEERRKSNHFAAVSPYVPFKTIILRVWAFDFQRPSD